jgi:putative membrane protein
MLWLSSDWPIHDISEEYLYSVHMFQHMALSYFLPLVAILSTPPWLFRAVLGSPRAGRVIRWLAKPVIAGFVFNVVIIVTHIPAMVNQSVSSPLLHSCGFPSQHRTKQCESGTAGAWCICSSCQ